MSLMKGKKLFITYHEGCILIDGTTGTVNICPCLQCFKEETDTRIILHSYHACDSGYGNNLVSSPDTDVWLLLLTLSSVFTERVQFTTGSKNSAIVTAIKALAREFEPSHFRALPGFHAFTSCASVDAFLSKVKVRPFQYYINDPE